MFNPTDEALFNVHKQAAFDIIRERYDDQVKAMVGSDLADRVFDALAGRRGRFIKDDTVSAFLLTTAYRLSKELTPAEKEIVDLIDAGHTVESAARELDMPTATAEWRLAKARRHLAAVA